MPATTEGWKKRRAPSVEAYIKSKTKRVGKCLIWQCGGGATGSFNYDGDIGIPSRKVYEHRVGPIAKGKCILHKCDTPRCVDGRHLYQGTKKQNRADFMKRHPHARKLCLEAAKIGAAGVKRFWDGMTPRQRKAFCKRRRDAQKACNGFKGGRKLK